MPEHSFTVKPSFLLLFFSLLCHLCLFLLFVLSLVVQLDLNCIFVRLLWFCALKTRIVSVHSFTLLFFFFSMSLLFSLRLFISLTSSSSTPMTPFHAIDLSLSLQ